MKKNDIIAKVHLETGIPMRNLLEFSEKTIFSWEIMITQNNFSEEFEKLSEESMRSFRKQFE